MILKIILFVLALMLLTACTGTRDRRTPSSSYYYDPCEQMHVEAEQAEALKGDVRDLNRTAYAEPAPDAPEDTAAKVSAESLLVQKEDLLAMTMQSMQQNAQACASRSRGYDEENP
jgi:hypothetical protein